MAKAVKNKLAQPFLKWAGGKRQLLPEIRKYVPKGYNTYFEPFVGAGAVLFDLQPKKAIINDINTELFNVYNVIKNNVELLIEELKEHERNNSHEYFYKIRDIDRSDIEYNNLSEINKAARIIYLNKTCFNGLFRVNSQGQFNVPFGRYKNPLIVNEFVLRAVNSYLVSNNVTVLNGDFLQAVSSAKKGDFVYFDPPYHPISPTSSFTGYSLDGFKESDQVRLRDLCIELRDRGCHILLSNSASQFIKDIYKEAGFHIEIVSATRNINSVASKRGKIEEVLVMNEDPKKHN